MMLIEVKDCNGNCSRAFERWALFLTVPLGKGLLYCFIGLLVMSQGFILISPSFLVGAYVTLMGVMCAAFHRSSEVLDPADANYITNP